MAAEATPQPPVGVSGAGLVRSMTGCGTGTAHDDAGVGCRVELRCVNNRFFKFALRARDGFAALEARAEGIVRSRVRRGSVQMSLDLSGMAGLAGRRLDAAQLAAYFDDLADFSAARGLPAPTAVTPLFVLPGVVVDRSADGSLAERVWPLVAEALEGALGALERMRRAEGLALAADLRATCGEIRSLAAQVAARAPRLIEEARGRLVERLRVVLEPQGIPVAPADIVREVAVVAEKCDINEELVRLGSHLDQFERLLDTEAPGRPLDFLAQELAREANTIAAKSPDADIAHAVVEIKSRIERLREQVQNVE
jgi:uncharacterized protein (TIGR00255 family)